MYGCGLTTCSWPFFALPRYSAGSSHLGMGGQSGRFIFSMVVEYISMRPEGVCSGFFTGSARNSPWRTQPLAAAGVGRVISPFSQNSSKGMSFAAELFS
mgnify:CR=1 FL=1